MLEKWMIEADLYRYRKALRDNPPPNKRAILEKLVDRNEQLLITLFLGGEIKTKAA